MIFDSGRNMVGAGVFPVVGRHEQEQDGGTGRSVQDPIYQIVIVILIQYVRSIVYTELDDDEIRVRAQERGDTVHAEVGVGRSDTGIDKSKGAVGKCPTPEGFHDGGVAVRSRGCSGSLCDRPSEHADGHGLAGLRFSNGLCQTEGVCCGIVTCSRLVRNGGQWNGRLKHRIREFRKF